MPSPSTHRGSSFAGDYAPGTELIGRYRVVALLGEGGMGQVYLADDLVLGESVAIKFLPEHLAERDGALERFRAEVRHAREVTHPNVARVHDIGEVDGRHFLTMEFVDGEDLSSLIRRIGRLPREKASEIAQQVCAGLAEAHRKGVLHRDLKPANVMLDGEGHVRLTDFGLAVPMDAEDGTGGLAGTPQHMAPELLSGLPASVASEVYSLGLLIYELYTGRRALRGSSLDELRREHEEGGAGAPSSVQTDIDPEVDAVLTRCLARDPRGRPSSVREVAQALPGGDPLAAAIAAGQTPAPELVANAADAGGLGARTVVACLAVVIVGLAALIVKRDHTEIRPVRSTEMLAIQAEQVLEELGYRDLPRNEARGFDRNLSIEQELAEQPSSRAELADRPWPPRFRFWRRWSSGSLQPSEFHAPEEVGLSDPPQTLPGDAAVALDDEGGLLALTVVPDPGAAAGGGEEVDFAPLLDRAGLEPSSVSSLTPVRAPPVACQQVVAWKGEIGGVSVIAQAGAYGGRAVYFELVGAGEFDAPDGAPTFFAAMQLVIFLVGALFAWGHLRLDRADRRVAARVALLMGASYFLIEVFATRLGERSLLVQARDLVWARSGSHVILHAVHGWVLYLAIEPFVRRLWPTMLVGWMRLFSGRTRDPRVGREVLLGATIGVAMAALAPWSIPAGSGAPSLAFGLGSLLGTRALTVLSLYAIAGTLLQVLSFVTLLFLVRLVVRRDWIMAGLVSLLFAALSLGPDQANGGEGIGS